MHRFKHISRFVIVLFSLQLLVQFVEAQVFEHPGGLHSRTQLETARVQIAAATPSLVAAFECSWNKQTSVWKDHRRPSKISVCLAITEMQKGIARSWAG